MNDNAQQPERNPIETAFKSSARNMRFENEKKVWRKSEKVLFADGDGLWGSDLGLCLTQNFNYENPSLLALDFRKFNDFFVFYKNKISKI